MRALLALLTLVGLLLIPGRARGDGTPPPSRVATAVVAGIYINQIHDLNLKENYFVVDAYIWFRWKGDDVKPNETFAFVDGRVESKSEVSVKKLPDGFTYACYRVVVKVTKYWDVRQYPLDRHTLTLTIEEDKEEAQVVIYEADVTNSGLGPNVRMPGYLTTNDGTKSGLGEYHSNFGDTSLPDGKTSRYARVSTSIGLAREGNTYVAKLFVALWIAAAIAFLSFFIKPTNVDPRFGLGVGAMFAAIASEYTVTSGLPEIGVATLADRIHVVAYAAIFITLAQSTASLWLFEHGREEASRRVDKQFCIGLPIAFAVANALVIALR